MNTGIMRFGMATALAAMMTLPAPVLAQQPDSASILIYDASGSMWAQLEGGITKVEIARQVIGDFFVSRDNAVPLGVIAYGHNRRGDCTDIEVIAEVGINDPAGLSARLNRLNPRGMTPITASLSLAASMIPPTAESADIILVTDGLETCQADPCALAAQLAGEGIAIRAHVVGFGLTNEEAEAMACVTDATGGLLLRPQTGQELADALDQVARLAPAPEPEAVPEPVQEAFFDIGPSAEAGYTYTITYRGTARNSDFAGFTPRGEGTPRSSASFGPIGGSTTAPNNPFSKQAPTEPGAYDLILFRSGGEGIIARQPIDVVPPSSGFDAVGSVEPGQRFEIGWRGPNQTSQRIVIAQPGAAPDDFSNELGSWDYPYNSRQNQIMRLTAPGEPGIYELRYLSANRQEILFSREFAVGVPFEDTDQTNTADLAAQAATATQAVPGQDALPMVRATFRIPDNFPQTPLRWEAVPLDPDMNPEAWAPVSDLFVGEGAFEPGRYRVSATGPGETTFSAVVEIYPGQDNSFVIPVAGNEDDRDAMLSISGDWRVLAVAPRDAPSGSPDQPIVMASVALMVNMAGSAYEGMLSPTGHLVGPNGATTAIALESVTEEQGNLYLRFSLTAVSPAPFTLSLAPFGKGYAGIMAASPDSLPVIFWPTGRDYPPLAQMQEVLYGPDPDEAARRYQELVPTVFACDAPTCLWTDPGSGLRAELPQGWSVTGPVFFAAVGDALPIENPRMEFRGPEGAELRLNPHQWLDSNGPCIATADLGALCHWADATGATRIAAAFIAQSLQRGSPDAMAPADACGEDVCLVRNDDFGIEAQLPRGWMMWQLARVDGALEGQFTNGDSILMLIPADRWNPENGPCFDSAAGPVCYWAEGDPAARLAAPFIAANLAVDPVDAGAFEATSKPELAGDQAFSPAPAPPPAPVSSGSETIIPVDLGGRDPEVVLRALLNNQTGN